MDSEPEKDARDEEVEFLYLELDTPLPTPFITSPPGPGQSPAPECPDLKKYSSPFLWPKWRKSMMTWISCAVTALAGYSAGEISPSSAELTKEWGISPVVYNLGITLFCIGFALAPMVLAPFSEINGRRPIFIASGIVFVGMVYLMNDGQTLADTNNLRSKHASLPVEALTPLEESLWHDSSRAQVDVCQFSH
jgi:hypothetical protein